MQAPSNSKKKVGRPKSSCRDHFQQVNVFDGKRGMNVLKWKCKHCELHYGERTGTANFTRHLKTSHAIEFDEKGDQISSNPNLVNMGYDGSPRFSPSAGSPTSMTPQSQSPINTPYMSPPQSNQYEPTSVIQPELIYPVSAFLQPTNPIHMTMPGHMQTMSANYNTDGNLCYFPREAFTQQESQKNSNALLTPSLQFNQQMMHYTPISLMSMLDDPCISNQAASYINPQLTMNITQIDDYIKENITTADVQWNPNSADPSFMSALSHESNANDGQHLHMDANSSTETETYVEQAQNVGSKVNTLMPEISSEQFLNQTEFGFPSTFLSSLVQSQTENSFEGKPLSHIVPTLTDLLTIKTSINKTSEELQDTSNLNIEIANELMKTNTTKIHASDSSSMQITKKSQRYNYFLVNDSASRTRKHEPPLKRKQSELDDDEFQEVNGLDDIYNEMEKRGRTRIEIQDKMVEMAVNSPMHLTSFLLSNIHEFFSMTNAKFPKLGLSLIDTKMLGRKYDKLKDIIKDQCDPKWDPFIFDVFVFPMALDTLNNYIMIELVYLDKRGHRRSCPMDCFSILPHYNTEELPTIILLKLKEFGVENKIADFHVWGKKYQNLQRVLRKTIIRRGQQRALAFEGNEEKKMEYFSSLKKKQEDSFYGIQIEASQCLSSLDQMEGILKKHQQYLKNQEGCQAMSESTKSFSPCFLKRASQRFQELGRKMMDIKNVVTDIEKRLYKISRDRKYAVYYSNKNNPINLLQIIPIHSYEQMLKYLACYVNNFTELLENANGDNSKDPMSNMSEIEEELRIIELEEVLRESEIPSLEPVEMIEMVLEALEKWRHILHTGVKISSDYYKLCEHFATYRTRDHVRSRYAKEFENVDFSAPKDMSPEEWKKAAILKAWKKFELDSYH